MTKTMKKILIAMILFITILLLKSTNVFAMNYEDYINTEFTKIKDDKITSYNIYMGEKIYPIKNPNVTFGIILTPKDNHIVSIENKYVIKGKKAGTTTVTIELNNPYTKEELKKTITVNVKKTTSSTKLESKINDVVSITDVSNKKTNVLLANGELWKTNKKDYKLNKKETGNVKKFVYSYVYNYQGGEKYTDRIMVKSTLKNDNTLVTDNSKEKLNIKNVKEVTSYGYLTTKNEFYVYRIDKKGKLKRDKKFTNVKKLVGDYLVVKKGKTYSISGEKVCDFEVKDADIYSVRPYGLLLATNGKLYFTKNVYNEKTKKYVQETKKIDEKVSELLGGNHWYKTKAGKVKQYKDYESQPTTKIKKTFYPWSNKKQTSNQLTLMMNGKVKLNDVQILDKVDDIVYDYNGENSVLLITRKDGSIWKFDIDEKNALTKVRSGKDKYKDLSTPKNVKASKSGKNAVKVKWGKVEGSSQYTVYRATSKNGKYKKIGTSNGTSYTDKKVKKGKTYYYKIVANHSNSEFNSTKSSSVKIKR